MIDLLLFDWELTHNQIVGAVLNGLIYALLAVGLVLIYRTSGVINFALGQMASLPVVLFVLFNGRAELNWYLAFVLVVILGGLIGLIIELSVVRRLFNSPRLVLLIATIGVNGVLAFILFQIALHGGLPSGPINKPFNLNWEVTDNLTLRTRELIVLFIAPIVVAVLAWFLGKTRFGLWLRATADNPDTARVYGISPKRTSSIVWSLAGALAAVTGMLYATRIDVQPASLQQAQLFSQPLLLNALAVALIARMRSVPGCFLAGIGIGFFEVFIKMAADDDALYNVWLLVLIVALVLSSSKIREVTGSFSLAPKARAVPTRLRSIWWIRNLGGLGLLGLFVALALVGLLSTNPSWYAFWANVIVFMIIAQSVSLLTGWAGQLSLGQFAFAGLGGMSMLALTQGHEIPITGWTPELPWLVALLIATALGAFVAFLIGVPALRVRGLFLAIATFAFAAAAAGWLLSQDVFTDGRSSPRVPDRPTLFGINMEESFSAYYYFVLLCLGIVSLLLVQLRRTGIGRTIIAVRENEEAAAASTISVTRAKLIAFAISGGIAAFGGALLITSLTGAVTPANQFNITQSIDVVAMAVIGGLGSVAGPILGVLFVKGVPALVGTLGWGSYTTPPDLVKLFTGNIGLLILLMYFPGGLMQFANQFREVVFRYAEKRLPETDDAGLLEAPVTKTVPAKPEKVQLPEGAVPLRARNVTVRFGGNVAVNDVTFEVGENELVGLIGTNGAGKSTLMNAISGFVPSEGSVEVLGREVSGMSAHQRHAVGLGRGFQAAKLYPDLTIRETLMVALEARESSMLVPSMTHLPPSPRMERRKMGEADELIDFLGLGRYADDFISNLSTGTRRICELGSLLAVNSSVLMLDEPTGGVAQKETEAFGPLIRRIQSELEASVVVIEHDMPLIMAISDRVYCLEAGSVIAHGEPEEVRNDPLVIATYLGTDTRAIDRSDS